MLRSVGKSRLAWVVPFVVLLLFGLSTAGVIVAQEQKEAAKPQVTVEAITVEPSNPGPDTLCRLKVKLRNGGDRVASQFGFTVTINGEKLPVYTNQLFMYPVQPGGVAELALYNFWTTETSRPRPADGKLAIAVTLEEAQWMDISTDADKVEVWKPLGAVEGLPGSTSLTLQLR